MDTLVERAVGILETEPIDIYVNPTFLPDVLAKDYDKLWTEGRVRKVIDAAVRERCGDRDQRPLQAAERVVHQDGQGRGRKFTFGTNNTGPQDLLRCDYGMQMIEECGLKWQDFFFPGDQRKGDRAQGRRSAGLIRLRAGKRMMLCSAGVSLCHVERAIVATSRLSSMYQRRTYRMLTRARGVSAVCWRAAVQRPGMPDQHVADFQGNGCISISDELHGPQRFRCRHAVCAGRDFNRSIPGCDASQTEADEQHVRGQE